MWGRGGNMSARVWLVYLTAPTAREADRLGELLVRERLAACVNRLGPIRSCYTWEGRLQKSREYALLAKTTARRWPALRRRVAAEHPYDCPCIVAWPPAAGHPAFLNWVRSAASASSRS